MVRMPPASCAAAAGCGGARASSVTNLGLSAKGRGGRGQRRAKLLAGRLEPVADPLGQMVVGAEIAEARDGGVELQLHGAGRAVALLADDDLGLAVHQRHLGLPLEVLFGARPRLLVAEVVFLAEHEQHHVGVLLDRAGFTQVRKLRALVVAVLDLTRELRQRHDRHVEFFGQRLEAGGDLGHLLHAAFVGLALRARSNWM